MAKAESFNVVNNREDKTDLYTVVSPEQTPILSGMPKFRSQKATLLEWTADNLDNVTFEGTREGVDQTTHKDKTENRVLLDNRHQEERKPYAVSNIQNKVDVAGVSDEVAFAQARSMLELKLNMESAQTSIQAFKLQQTQLEQLQLLLSLHLTMYYKVFMKLLVRLWICAYMLALNYKEKSLTSHAQKAQ